MPVTKTATRAMGVSKRKTVVNRNARTELEIAIRTAKKSKKEEDIKKAISLTDRAVKRHLMHKNKAARMKSALSKLAPVKKSTQKSPAKKPAKKAKK